MVVASAPEGRGKEAGAAARPALKSSQPSREAHASEPQPAEMVLRPALQEVAADRDDAILAAAKALLAMADADGKTGSRYKLEISGDAQGVVQGDHANVTMNFGNPSPGKG